MQVGSVQIKIINFYSKSWNKHTGLLGCICETKMRKCAHNQYPSTLMLNNFVNASYLWNQYIEEGIEHFIHFFRCLCSCNNGGQYSSWWCINLLLCFHSPWFGSYWNDTYQTISFNNGVDLWWRWWVINLCQTSWRIWQIGGSIWDNIFDLNLDWAWLPILS